MAGTLDAETVFTCMACEDFTTTLGVMLLAHQAICDSLSSEKRSFRMTMLKLQFGEHLNEVLQLAEEHQANNR